MNVPFVDLGELHRELAPTILDDWKEMVAGSDFIGGSRVARFEEAWAEYCGVDHAVGVANGTDALELILRALDVGAGDEVILPANTFAATAEAVALVGARPKFIDVDPHTLLMTADSVESAVGPRTAAVIAVHLYGGMPDMSSIRDVCRSNRLRLVEDAAQAHGARQSGRRAGSWGDAAAFSFYPGKNLGAFGEGGAVTTNDDLLARRIRSLSEHGRSASNRYMHENLGRNSRLDALQAAALSRTLPHLDRWNAGRMSAAQLYARLLPPWLTPPGVVPGTEAVYHLFVVRVDDRDAVCAAMSSRGIGVGIHYPVPCHLQAAFREFHDGPLPVCESAAAVVLSLPMHPGLNEAQIAYVCGVLEEATAGETRCQSATPNAI